MKFKDFSDTLALAAVSEADDCFFQPWPLPSPVPIFGQWEAPGPPVRT